MQRKFNAIADTKEWQDADFFGKVKIAWDEFIAEPFSEWWNSTGKAKFADFAQDIGAGIGTGLKVGGMDLGMCQSPHLYRTILCRCLPPLFPY